MAKSKLLTALLGASATFVLASALNVQAQNTTQSGSGTPQPAAGQSSTQGSTASGAGMASAKKLSAADQKLLRNMAQSNMSEIEAARLAQTKSQNDQVKSFAQRMIDDHTKALTDVQQVAQAKGVTLPTELTRAHKAKADKLAKLSGEQFDRAYMAQAGVADHKKAHSQLRSAANRARDPDVKALATRIQPSVEEHLKMAQDLHADHSGKSGATGSSGAAGTTGSGTSGTGATGSGTGTTGTTGTGTTTDPAKDKR